jgi:hypothetical protein
MFSMISKKLYYKIGTGINSFFIINSYDKTYYRDLEQRILFDKNKYIKSVTYEVINSKEVNYNFSPKKFTFDNLTTLSFSIVNGFEFYINDRWYFSVDIPFNYYPLVAFYSFSDLNYGIVCRINFKF